MPQEKAKYVCGHPTMSGGQCKNPVARPGQWCGRCKPQPTEKMPRALGTRRLKVHQRQALSDRTGNKDDSALEAPGLASPELVEVLESAARLQEVVPDAALVGGTAAALWVDHRKSFDHHHVVADLAQRFDVVLEAIESTKGWVTNRVVPRKVILGELGGIEAGVRQMVRKRPLEVMEVALPSGHRLRAPTPDETLRIKGYLVVEGNQTRDYIDVAALADRFGKEHAATVLAHIDDFYADQRDPAAAGVATQLAVQLADPRPKDRLSAAQLKQYKGLEAQWTEWRNVARACRILATLMATVSQ